MTRGAPAGQEQLKAQAVLAELRAEREAVRAETRAMHEQVQEARDTLAYLEQMIARAREWIEMNIDGIDAKVETAVSDRIRLANEHIDTGMRDVVGELADVKRRIADYQARELGFKSGEDLLARIVSDFRRPDYVQKVADIVARAHGCDCPSGAHSVLGQRRQDGQVFVRVAEPGERLGMYIDGHYIGGDE